MKTMQHLVRLHSVVAGAVAWVASLLAALLYSAPNGWSGADELTGMALWSLPFAVVIALASAVTGAGSRPRGLLRAYGAAAILGPALGVASFAGAVALRGGWVGAFPVFTCWAFGGLLGLVAAVLTRRPRSVLVASGVCLAALAVLLWSHAVLRRLG